MINRKKHSTLFSVLAIVLACLLLNAYTIHNVYAAFGIDDLIIFSLLGMAIGAGIMYLWMSYTQPAGVTIPDYVNDLIDMYMVDLKDISSRAVLASDFATKVQKYYIAWAEYEAVSYVGSDTFPEENVMRHVTEELCELQYQAIGAIDKRLTDIDLLNDNKLTPDLDKGGTYDIVVNILFGEGGTVNLNDYEGEIWIGAKAKGNITAWDCNEGRIITIQDGSIFRLAKYLILEGDYDVHACTTEGCGNIILSVGGVMIFPGGKAEERGIIQDIKKITTNFASVYANAKVWAEVYWQQLKDAGYNDPSQVPSHLKCPPPTIAIPGPSELFNRGLTFEQARQAYLKTLAAISEKFKNMSDVCGVNFKPENVSVPGGGVMKNVTVTIGNTTYVFEEFQIISIACNAHFTENQETIIECTATALVKFPNGTVTTITLPAGSKVIPREVYNENGQRTGSQDVGPQPLPDYINYLGRMNGQNPNVIGAPNQLLAQTLGFFGVMFPVMLVMMLFVVLLNTFRDVARRR